VAKGSRRQTDRGKPLPPLLKDIRTIRRRLPLARVFIEHPGPGVELLALAEGLARRQPLEKIFDRVVTKPDGHPKRWAVSLLQRAPLAVDIALQLNRHALALHALALSGLVDSSPSEDVYHRRINRIEKAVAHARRKADLRSAQSRHRLKETETKGLDDTQQERLDLHHKAEQSVLALLAQYVTEERADLPAPSPSRAQRALEEAVKVAIRNLGRVGLPPRAILEFLDAQPAMILAGYVPSRFHSLAAVKKTLQRKARNAP
jgi:hypothetical protein